MTVQVDHQLWRKGWIWISAVGLITAIAGWLVYDAMMAPSWMRKFGLDIAARATIVGAPSDQTAFSTMKGREAPDSPYICFADSAAFAWDRVYFVASGGPIVPPLADLDWQGEDLTAMNERLARDERYQLVAFQRDDQVVEFSYYFKIWADLTALDRTEGFDRATAVFTSESDGEIYTLKPAEPGQLAACN
ncbi:MAG: hypothetical protein RIC29_03080 [Rhodospirillaceae bacterium]